MLARAIIVASTLCIVSFPVAAQQGPQPVFYQLKVDAKTVGEIVDALSERPFKSVAPVIQEIGRQIQEQNQAREWEKKQPAMPVPPAAPQEPPK